MAWPVLSDEAAPMQLRLLAVIFVNGCLAGGAPAGVGEYESPPAASPRDVVRGLREACAQFASVRCDQLSLCGSFVDRALYADVDACAHAVTESCVAERSLPGMIGAVERVLSCARGIEALSCRARRDPLAQARACDGTLERGVFADGDLCVRDAQCAGGACARGPHGCGVCVRAPVVGDRCASGCGALSCNAQLGTCEPPPPIAIGDARAGESCDEAVCDAGDGLVCLGAEARRCAITQIVPLGGSCADLASGLPVLCGATDARCDRSTWTCAPKLALGMPCDLHDECVAGAVCVRSNGRYRCVAEADACR